MKEANISSKQPHKHRYKIAEDESKIAPHLLQREFNVEAPNKVWCGDVTYIWAGTQWLYLAIVMDLYPKRLRFRCLECDHDCSPLGATTQHSHSM